MYSGLPLAKSLVRPGCECPRKDTDSFGFMRAVRVGASVEDSCYDAFSNEARRRRFGTPPVGKWAMFLHRGWVSDFTNQAEIVIRMKQPMLVSVYVIMAVTFPITPFICVYFAL